MNRYFIFFLGLFLFVSCKSDVKVDDVKKETTAVKNEPAAKAAPEENKQENVAKLVNPCSLISKEQLADILGVSAENISIKTLPASGTYSRSCFLRWENVENGSQRSMFFVLQTDPLPGDFEDWAHSFLDAKKTSGDIKYPDSGKPYKYISIDGFDKEVAYNDDLKKVFWKIDKDYVGAIFFNAGLTSHNRKLYASEIAKIISKNLKNKI